ncbi:hypothetical protein F2Q68_00006885 [Brassica cretica]|uniref:GDSL esterase/lipase n=1 Tax=Brassica cretica TaxID=69181 RepID=A0A8S9J910_BRACR|nr:hypothetical protein F2Q68_00006885 [Brassica cretica]
MAGKCTLASVLGLLLVLTLFQNPLTVCGQSIPAVALFTFGDSNFDAGNKQTLTQVNVAQGFWPYGKSRDDPNGKFSDGFIAPDFVGECTLASVLGLLLVLTLFQNPLTVCGQSIPAVALFTFGDSNFDAGNKQTLTQVNVAQGFWPYGKSRDDPNGKFSDGFIAPDFVGFRWMLALIDDGCFGVWSFSVGVYGYTVQVPETILFSFLVYEERYIEDQYEVLKASGGERRFNESKMTNSPSSSIFFCDFPDLTHSRLLQLTRSLYGSAPRHTDHLHFATVTFR